MKTKEHLAVMNSNSFIENPRTVSEKIAKKINLKKSAL